MCDFGNPVYYLYDNIWLGEKLSQYYASASVCKSALDVIFDITIAVCYNTVGPVGM